MDSTPASRQHSNALRLLSALEEAGFPTRLVGGCVRDRILGLIPKDYDLATTALPEDVTALCKKGRFFKAIPTGLQHGTITVVIQSHPYEVTTLRKDVASDGRWAEVSFGNDFEEDAARRDFTMNAMSEDATGRVYDYFGGKADLQAHRLVFVGDPATRIKEDYLRILRFFRFLARFNLQTAPPTLEAISAHCHGLQGISRERVSSELKGLLSCPYPEMSLTLMHSTGVLGEIFPTSAVKRLTTSDASKLFALISKNDNLKQMSSQALSLARLALLLTLGDASAFKEDSYPKYLETIETLRLSKLERNSLAFVHEGFRKLPTLTLDTAGAFEFFDRCDDQAGKDAYALFYEPIWKTVLASVDAPEQMRTLACLETTLKQMGHRRHRVMPVTGREVMAWTGLHSGKELGEKLVKITRAFHNGLWETAEEARKFLEEHQDED